MLKQRNENELFHLGFSPDEFTAEYAIIPGDPGRVEKIASYLENAAPVAFRREYKTYIGELSGKKVFVCSTGIGGPSAAIAVEELIQAGVKTFIRVGTAGGINLDVDGGDVVIASSAIRQEGTSVHYAPIEYPAAANFEVVMALHESAKKFDVKTRTGVVQSKDSFYGQHAPESSPVSYELFEKWNSWKRLGVLASEMECAALFTVAASRGVRAGAVLAVLWNQERAAAGMPTKEVHDTDTAIQIAVEAIKLL